MSRIDELKARMDELNRQILELKVKRDHTANTYDEKIYELERQIDEIRNQRDKETAPYEQQIKALKDEYNELHNEHDELTMQEAWKRFQQTGEITEETIRSMGYTHYAVRNLHPEGWTVDIHPRGYKLPNGIHIVRIEHNGFETFTRHLALYKGKLIGMWVRRKAEHQGDETHPYAFIELEKDKIPTYKPSESYSKPIFDTLIIDDRGILFRESEENRENHRHHYNHRIKYNEWRKALKDLTQEQLENAVGIDLMDERNRKYLVETDWIRW